MGSAASNIGNLIRAVSKSPEATILGAGLLLVIVALVAQIGPFQLQTRGSLLLTLAIGCILTTVGAVWVGSARRAVSKEFPDVFREGVPEVALDTKLLLKVFLKAMPPAFVKEYSPSQPGAHVMQSESLLEYQRSPETAPMPHGGRRAVIKSDHLAGDKRTVEEGYSRQLELTDMVSGERERLILTVKTHITHEGRDYIAGWYVPVERPRQLPADSVLCLKEDIHQIVYRLAIAKPGEGILVHIGEAVSQAEGISNQDAS